MGRSQKTKFKKVRQIKLSHACGHEQDARASNLQSWLTMPRLTSRLSLMFGGKNKDENPITAIKAKPVFKLSLRNQAVKANYVFRLLFKNQVGIGWSRYQKKSQSLLDRDFFKTDTKPFINF
ncbi:hypothetical protein [Sabulibacter ruber]|uniref:hypothetical protein n=1 Tax=Sabulibacter ruber TaxID=2811901 RepID=UPI001A9586CB|nr:hypothetical protein [Sabulibacter ruber]